MEISPYTDMAIMYGSEYGLKIISAVLIFVIGKWAIHKITALSKKLMLKSNVDETLVDFSQSVIYFVLLIMVILASLNALGINTTSFLAVFGAASLAVGLALKDSLSNIGAAVIIILFRPFKVGDLIQAGGANGTVEDINLFSTVLIAADKSMIIVPNSAIIGGNIVNFSNREIRNVEYIISIGYEDDLKLAKEILMQIIKEDARTLQDPPPVVAVGKLAQNSVDFIFRAWVKSDDYLDAYSDMLEKVKLAFDEKGISAPYPQMDIHMSNTENQKGK